MTLGQRCQTGFTSWATLNSFCPCKVVKVHLQSDISLCRKEKCNFTSTSELSLMHFCTRWWKKTGTFCNLSACLLFIYFGVVWITFDEVGSCKGICFFPNSSLFYYLFIIIENDSRLWYGWVTQRIEFVISDLCEAFQLKMSERPDTNPRRTGNFTTLHKEQKTLKY